MLSVPRLSLEQPALGRSFHHRGTTNEKSLATDRRKRQQPVVVESVNSAFITAVK